jgi:hypothetical protein
MEKPSVRMIAQPPTGSHVRAQVTTATGEIGKSCASGVPTRPPHRKRATIRHLQEDARLAAPAVAPEREAISSVRGKRDPLGLDVGGVFGNSIAVLAGRTGALAHDEPTE